MLGIDIDEIKLDLARREAAALQLHHVEFKRASVGDDAGELEFDLAYSRFLLTHLSNPLRALEKMRDSLRPGGVVVVEDIDSRGHFSYPECDAFQRYVELYAETVRRRGGDPNIGPRLPTLIRDAGFQQVQLQVVQLAALEGDVKLMSPLTMENIASSVVAEGLATQEDVDRIIAELYRFADDPRTLMSVPRIVQAWGHRT